MCHNFPNWFHLVGNFAGIQFFTIIVSLQPNFLFLQKFLHLDDFFSTWEAISWKLLSDPTTPQGQGWDPEWTWWVMDRGLPPHSRRIV